MGGAIAKLVFKSGNDVIATKYESANEIPVVDLLGVEHDKIGNLVEGKKVYLIVNVASR